VRKFGAMVNMVCLKSTPSDSAPEEYCLTKLASAKLQLSVENPSDNAVDLMKQMQETGDDTLMKSLCSSGCLSRFVAAASQVQKKVSEETGNNEFLNRMDKMVKFACLPDNGGLCMANYFKSIKTLRQNGCFRVGEQASCNGNCQALLENEFKFTTSPCCAAAMLRANENDHARVMTNVKNCTKSFKAQLDMECPLFSANKDAKVAKAKKRMNLNCEWAKANFETLKPRISSDLASGMGVPSEYIRNVFFDSCGSVNVGVEVQGYDDTQTNQLATAVANQDVTMPETEEQYASSGNSMYAPSSITGSSSATNLVISMASVLLAVLFAML